MSALNNSLLLGQEGGGGYAISRSLRFNAADSSFLSRTPASAGNRKTWTWAGWVKRSALGTRQVLFSAGSDGTEFYFGGSNNDQLVFYYYNGSSFAGNYATAALYRDPSAWLHVCLAVDTTQGTAGNRCKIYVNGSQITAFGTETQFSQNAEPDINAATAHNIGRSTGTSSRYFSGYLADIHFIDGQALDPTSFGEFDDNGIWQPKAFSGGSYGTNGFHLDFADNSTAAALGTDVSGKGNDWTVNNISVTAGIGNDSLIDVPTNGTEEDTGTGGEVRGNYATWNPLAVLTSTASSLVLSNGNLYANPRIAWGTVAIPSSGKWYWEIQITSSGSSGAIGIAEFDATYLDYYPSGNSVRGITYMANGNKVINATASSYGATYGNDTIGVAVNMDSDTITFYKNGASQGSISSVSTYLTEPFFPSAGDNSWARNPDYYINFGQRPFAYTAPSGFKALNTASLPAPVVTKPSTVMDVKLYTGNGSTQTISTDFSPDFLWFKARGDSGQHALYDIVRGASKSLVSNSTASEATEGGGLSSFDSAGFSLSGDNTVQGSTNGSGRSYVAWAFDAGSSTVTNTQGSISSQVRANASAGFSVVTYSSGSAPTVGHGLGAAPSLIIAKSRTQSLNWTVYHRSLGKDYVLELSSTNSAANIANYWGTSEPNSTVFGTYGTGSNGNNAGDMVAYCFAPVAGYSSMGSYVANGTSDNAFCYTGFRPRFLLLKASSTTGSWLMVDSARASYNLVTSYLLANASDAEGTADSVDFLSNGFKVRTSVGGIGVNGNTVIWAAFAESPFQYARAR
jgi:hypothetical protein